MNIDNPILVGIIYCSQQADGLLSAQAPMRGGHSYIPCDDTLPTSAKDMMHYIGKKSDCNADIPCQSKRSLLTTKKDIQMFKRLFQMRIIRQQQYVEVLQNCTHGIIADWSKVVLLTRM